MRCPDEKLLEQMVEGRLPASLFDQINDHVEECAACTQLVETMEASSEYSLRLVAVDDANISGESQFLASAVSNARSIEHRELLLSRVRDYQIVHFLGEGGMGVVYLALHLKLQKFVAMKFLSQARLQNDETLRRFQNEVRAAGRLAHPNIVQATDAGQENGQPFLVMEYIAGVDLAKLVRHNGAVDIANACEIVRQAAIGLAHAHRHDIVHRDVKPSNVMLSTDGMIKLLDLGLAMGGDIVDELRPMSQDGERLAGFVTPTHNSARFLFTRRVGLDWSVLSTAACQITFICCGLAFSLPAIEFFRRHFNVILSGLGYRLQEQPYDRVLRNEDRKEEQFHDLVEYIARNPERAGLIGVDEFKSYLYTGCMIPGFPTLDMWDDEYWPLFWRIYGTLARKGDVQLGNELTDW